MDHERQSQEPPVQAAGKPASWAVRAIDAWIRTLQRWRDRLAPPQEAAVDDSRRPGRPLEEGAPPPPPAPPGRLRRNLTLVVCLLVGAIGGMGFSYRLFSRMLDAGAAQIDFIQETVRQERHEEARLRRTQEICQEENQGYLQQLRDKQREADDCRSRLDASAPAAQEGGASSARPGDMPPARPRPPQKTGNCDIGPGNLSGNLANCIDKFNRP